MLSGNSLPPSLLSNSSVSSSNLNSGNHGNHGLCMGRTVSIHRNGSQVNLNGQANGIGHLGQSANASYNSSAAPSHHFMSQHGSTAHQMLQQYSSPGNGFSPDFQTGSLSTTQQQQQQQQHYLNMMSVNSNTNQALGIYNSTQLTPPPSIKQEPSPSLSLSSSNHAISHGDRHSPLQQQQQHLQNARSSTRSSSNPVGAVACANAGYSSSATPNEFMYGGGGGGGVAANSSLANKTTSNQMHHHHHHHHQLQQAQQQHQLSPLSGDINANNHHQNLPPSFDFLQSFIEYDIRMIAPFVKQLTDMTL